MAISAEDFQAVLATLTQLLPMQRQLDAAALVMAWDTWPRAAKTQLTASMLQFAAGQRQMDPAPPREVALHMALLRYLFPIENDRPVVDRGLRPDLAERMQAPDRFHDPAPLREDLRPARERAPRLPAGGAWHPSMLTTEQRHAHVRRVEARMEQIVAAGPDGRIWVASQLDQGFRWFDRALQGFWPLQADQGGIAAAWIQRNPNQARAMVAQALTVDVQALPAGAGLAVSGIVGGLGSW